MIKPTTYSIMHLTYDMRIGGTEMVIRNLIESSDNNLFNMSIYCIETPIGPWGRELQNSGISVTSKDRNHGFDKKLISSIRTHIKQNNIDVIHCHQYTPWVYGVLAAFGTKTKVLFTEHGRFYPDSSSWKRKLVNPWLCRITDRIVAISKATKQALVDFEYIPAKKIEVIYNGIKTPEVIADKTEALRKKLGITADTILLGTIARLDPIKNHKMMLDAFSSILKTHSNSKLIIVGDGDERENIKEQIQKFGIENKVIMPGYDSEPQHYLALIDIFLLSSLSEGTSMTLLEAMSLKKSCVVTDAGGNREIIENGINGHVTLNDDAQAFANGVLNIMNSFETRQRMEKEALSRFKSLFHVNTMAKHYETIYLNLCEK
ncbi:glycosyltransferase [Paraglaciecola sp. 2405UD69-4]|uniref:glycosyltransferase n=1 Tax=Paraglaciecola sp. 2405UD69-4 TaxID=3391836 RepID=UPI0039C8E07C